MPMPDPASSSQRWRAAGVHLFTATGAVCAMLAVLATLAHQYEIAFAWLGLAQIIDGIDGYFARKARVKEVLSRWSGDDLDHVVDYTTYVFVPALMLIEAGYLPGVGGIGLAALILLSSLYHFADTHSKTDDNNFVGFPAIWNIVAFYVFALNLSLAWTAAVVLICVVMTFVPLKWAHPLRVVVLRPVTAFFVAIWTVAAVWALAQGFPVDWGPRLMLLMAAAYAVGLSVWQGFAPATLGPQHLVSEQLSPPDARE